MKDARTLEIARCIDAVDHDWDGGGRSRFEGASCLFGPGPDLSPLTLETSNALLPPFGSHLVGW